MWRTVVLLILCSLWMTACRGDESGHPESLILLAHDSFAESVSEETFAPFTEDTGIHVDLVSLGDAGVMVNQAVLSAQNPIADVLFGVDDTFLSRAIEGNVFASYRSALLDRVDPALVPDTDLVTPIDYGDVCLNYDKKALTAKGVSPPSSLEQLRSHEYASLLTVEHPATSSPGLAFLLATIAEYGEEGWQNFWRDLAAGGVHVASDWTTAYTAEFTRYGGESPMVVSYASSPPFEVLFGEGAGDEAPTAIMEAGCYRQIEYAGVLNGTDHPEAAGRLIDFMLSTGFQETIPLTWFVFPANTEATIPDEFLDNISIPNDPAHIDYQRIAENRDRWTNEWIDVMTG